MIDKITGFLGNVKAEMGKVTFPTRKDTYASTLVVIVLVMLVAVYLWLVDIGLARIIGSILPTV